MAPLKIIGVGYGRTGTLSLCNALEILGFSCHHMQKVILDSTQNPADFSDAYLQKASPDWDQVFVNYDATVDWPAAAVWEELWKKYPTAKIILTTRDPEQWYDSIKSTIHGVYMDEQHNWPERMIQVQEMSRVIVRDGVLKDFQDREKTVRQFQDHTAYVKSMVPSNQLLVMKLGDGWNPLCDFLGVPPPEGILYPNVNKGVDFEKKVSDFKARLEQQ